MHVIVYTSELATRKSDVKKLLPDIVSKAKINNAELGVTGLLFYYNQRFLQIIEGEQASLEQLMAVIEKDPRHKNIVRIIDEDIYQKSFAQWNMDYLNLSENAGIGMEELHLISDTVKKNMDVDTGMLAYFFNAMLELQDLIKSKS